MTFQTYIGEGKARLEAARLECRDPLLHMKQIIQAALEIESVDLVMRWKEELAPREISKVERVLARRLLGEPFQYIVGYEWFWDARFSVGPGVLIPRPETELLVELALSSVGPEKARIAELGAGSGAIGISLLRQQPHWEWSTWENNPASLPYLRRNLALLPPEAKYHWHEGDFFQAVESVGPFDWIVANPPYVKHGEQESLSKEVRHEPFQALDGGETGLDCIDRIIHLAPRVLAPGGGVILEIGSDQGAQVSALLNHSNFKDVAIHKDLAGLDRVAFGRKRS